MFVIHPHNYHSFYKRSGITPDNRQLCPGKLVDYHLIIPILADGLGLVFGIIK